MNKKELFYISLCIFCTVIAWLIADIYHASTVEKMKTKIELPSLQKYEINKNTLLILKNKTP
ncbi:MAG: hypothetical protein Q7R95_00495 [bacterium]|nr:hypothetical protein [bacterium]